MNDFASRSLRLFQMLGIGQRIRVSKARRLSLPIRTLRATGTPSTGTSTIGYTNKSTWGHSPRAPTEGVAYRPLHPRAQAADNIIGEASAVSTRRGQPGSPQSIWSWNGSQPRSRSWGPAYRNEPPMKLDEGSARLLGTIAANVFDRLNQAPADQKKNCPAQKVNQESS